MRNTVIITIMLFVAVIAATIYYFSDSNGKAENTTKTLHLLPADTYFITTFNNNKTTDTIFENFELFEAIQGKKDYQSLNEIKQNFLVSTALKPLVENAEIIVSYHPNGKGIATLMSVALQESINTTHLESILQEGLKNYKISHTDTLNQRIYRLDKGVKDSLLYCTFYENVLFGSYSPEIIYQVLNKNVKKLQPEEIEFFIKNKHKSTALSLYFNNKEIAALAKNLMRSSFGTYLQQIDSLPGSTSWNLNFKSDGLIFKGVTNIASDSKNYLRLFSNQTAQVQTLANFLPKNTASYINYSISDVNLFQTGLQDLFSNRKEAEKIKRQQEALLKEHKLDFQKEILPLWNDEFALAALDNDDMLGLISLADTTQFVESLKKIGSNFGESIYQFKYSNLLYQSFGDPFETFQRPYFTRIGSVLIVANQTHLLKKFQKTYFDNQLLSGTAIFKNHNHLQSNRANVTFYIEPETAGSSIILNLKPDFSKNYRNKEAFGFQNFFSASIQLNGNNGEFVSSFYAPYKAKNRLGGTAEWSYQLNNKLINDPWIFEQNENSKFILVQEQDHHVHALSPTGKLLWSSLFEGEILGHPIQLQDRSILLNTRSRLYRFNPDGKMLEGFSVSLGKNASSGLIVTNFNKEKRIYIPCGQQIAAFDLTGNKISDWKDPHLDSKILFDLKSATVANQNYLIAGTSEGSVYFFNEQGTLLEKQELNVNGKTLKNPIGLIAASEKENSFILVAKEKGEIIKVPFSGTPSKQKIGDWGTEFSFNFEDVSGSADKDFVVLSDNNLTAYNQKDGSKYFSYKFVDQVHNRPTFFKVTNSKDLVAASTDNRLIYVFNEDGLVRDGFPIEGMSKFYFGPIDFGGNKPYLISTKRDHKLYVYKF